MGRLDRDYYRERAAAERRMAEVAEDERARSAHLELAREYEIKANIDRVSSRPDNDRFGIVAAEGGHPGSGEAAESPGGN